MAHSVQCEKNDFRLSFHITLACYAIMWKIKSSNILQIYHFGRHS